MKLEKLEELCQGESVLRGSGRLSRVWSFLKGRVTFSAKLHQCSSSLLTPFSGGLPEGTALFGLVLGVSEECPGNREWDQPHRMDGGLGHQENDSALTQQSGDPKPHSHSTGKFSELVRFLPRSPFLVSVKHREKQAQVGSFARLR